MINKSLFILIAAISFTRILFGTEATPPTDEKTSVPAILVADSKTQIVEEMILADIHATVNLRVGKLTLEDNKFVGTYQVQVQMDSLPKALQGLASSKNEEGSLELATDMSFDALKTTGAKLQGKGYCVKKGEYRSIVCEVIPDKEATDKGMLKMVIDSGKRLMHFETTYTVIDEGNAIALSE